MGIFRYSAVETDYLAERDPVLGRAIRRIGPIERRVTPDLFEALAESIVGQQISGKAAETVWRRLTVLTGGVTPQSIVQATVEALRGCGLSLRKVGYLQEAARAALEGRLDEKELAAMSDREVVDRLTALPGVGVWTAEMLMIFSMQRPNVVSYGDLAIRRGVMRLYGLEGLSRREFETYRSRWSPYGTVASFYLWAVAHEPDGMSPVEK